MCVTVWPKRSDQPDEEHQNSNPLVLHQRNQCTVIMPTCMQGAGRLHDTIPSQTCNSASAAHTGKRAWSPKVSQINAIVWLGFQSFSLTCSATSHIIVVLDREESGREQGEQGMSQNSISYARHAIAEVSYGAYGEQHLVQATAAPCRQRGTAAPAPLPPPRWELGSSPRCLPFRMIATCRAPWALPASGLPRAVRGHRRYQQVKKNKQGVIQTIAYDLNCKVHVPWMQNLNYTITIIIILYI
jgi:hypothetical protein